MSKAGRAKSGGSAFVTSCQVWMYRNIQTSQVILSPSRVLDNGRSMAQLPPHRRMHPTALRKDHWVPLLRATFADSATTRQIYARLMQYRHLRAEAPVPQEQRQLKRLARLRSNMNQIATSIADLAASCEAFAKTTPVKIDWHNENEQVHAKFWPDNVTHAPGLTQEPPTRVYKSKAPGLAEPGSAETQESTTQPTV